MALADYKAGIPPVSMQPDYIPYMLVYAPGAAVDDPAEKVYRASAGEYRDAGYTVEVIEPPAEPEPPAETVGGGDSLDLLKAW